MYESITYDNILCAAFSSELPLVGRMVEDAGRFLTRFGVSIEGFSLVLKELLENAIVHGNGGDKRRAVRCCVNVLELEETLKITVEDEGHGFADAQLLRNIRAKQPRKGASGYPLINSYARRVEFNGTGNCVSVYLPIVPDRSNWRAAPSSALVEDIGGNGRNRVLVMDHEGALFECVVGLLGQEEEFLVVGRAGLAAHGMEKAKGLRPDLAIVDTRATGLAGLESIHGLRYCCPDSAIIAVAHLPSRSNKISCQESGADAFLLSKDLKGLLVPTVKRLLKKRKRPAE